MTKTKKLGPLARYGPRYGYTTKKRALNIETKQRRKQTCEKCGRTSLKRKSNALWVCTKCDAVMAGGAFLPHTGAWKTIKSIIDRELRGANTVDMH